MLHKDGHREERTEMKYKRTTFLASIAALALVAGHGVATAQDTSKSESGQAPHATQQLDRGGTSSPSSHGAQTQERGSMSKQGQRAEGEKATTGAQKQEQNRSAQSNEKQRHDGRKQ
jgi:hypothetical protein